MADRLLLIEDDPRLGAQIRDRLVRDGYEVIWWQRGQEPDEDELAGVGLIVLDLMLPGTYGMDILRRVRERSDVPVLVLSARNDTADKVRALQLGADDYMTKPFWPEELVERVRARLRRPVLARSSILDVGPLRLDLESRDVWVDGQEVELTRVERDLLVALARRPGVAVTRAWLMEHVLDADRDSLQRTLDVHASRLRKKLGRPELIETVWGVGYRLRVGDG